METAEMLSEIGNIPVARVIQALNLQLEMRIDAALVSPSFDKSSVDDIANIIRTILKVRDLDIAQDSGNMEADDDYSMPEILNFIEERIETLAQERAKANAENILAEPGASSSTQTNIKQCAADASPSSTSTQTR